MPFHENLRTLRLARGLTQPMLAEKAGIEQSYLSKLENGRSKPSDDVLARLAQALEVKGETLAQDGDDAEERSQRWKRWGLGAAAAALLAVTFFVGRATAIYPLSFGEVIEGAHADQNLVLAVRELAPKGIDVINVASGGHAGSHLAVTGTTPDYATLDAYMGTIKTKFGGSFSVIQLNPADAGQLHHFDFSYEAPDAP
ncbi:MAG TPA: helix-turn-helix transcriptional regulator [Gammaproteobacteria bacterium]|jgi:transcriptional regulator with XRE-family HTH domain